MADFDYEGFVPTEGFCADLLKSGATAALLRREAEKVRARASSMFPGASYGVRVKTGKARAHAFVHTADRAAIASNRRHNTLKKSLRR